MCTVSSGGGEKISEELTAAGLPVVFVLDDGADAVAVLVAEQPEYVFTEERLPRVTGIELVRRARVLSPGSCVMVQAAEGHSLDEAWEAGACAAYSRRVSPEAIVEDLTGRLQRPRPSSVFAAQDEAAAAYAEARRLVFDFLTPDELDYLLLTEEQVQALRRLGAAEARLKQLRGEWLVDLDQPDPRFE